MTCIACGRAVGTKLQAEGVAWRRPSGNGYRQTAWAAVVAAAMSLPFLGVGGWTIYADWSTQQAAHRALAERQLSLVRLVAAPPAEPAPEASYLAANPDHLPTPMGSGIVAFAESAEAAAKQRAVGGRILDLQQLMEDDQNRTSTHSGTGIP